MFEQQYAITAILIMTTFNAILAFFMIAGILSVEYGMVIAFVGMFGVCWKCKRDLMGDIRLWENPRQYRNRMDTRILRGRLEDDESN